MDSTRFYFFSNVKTIQQRIKVYERADVYRARLDPSTGEGLEEKLLYKSCNHVGYHLPVGEGRCIHRCYRASIK